MRILRVLGIFAAASIAVSARAQQAPTTALNKIQSVQVVDGAVLITCAQRPNFTSLNLSAPARLVLDFSDPVLADSPREVAGAVKGMKGLRTEAFRSDTGAVARVVVTLEPDADTDIAAADGNGL